MKHLDEAKELWKRYVPEKGQAETKQGELLRSVENLRDEALRNGNDNWDDGHRYFVEFLRATLMGELSFTAEQKQQMSEDLDEIGLADSPPTSDAPYDRLLDRVVEWTHAHPEPVPHQHVADLNR